MTKATSEKALMGCVAYPPAWRMVSAILFTLSRGSLAVVAMAFLAGFLISPPLLVRIIVFLALIPGLAAVILRQVFAAQIDLRNGELVICRKGWYQRGQVVVLHPAAIKQVTPWRIPLPGPGLSILAASGNSSRCHALQMDNPASLLERMSFGNNAGQLFAARVMLVYARARAAAGVSSWPGILFKFGVFGLLPLFVAFRLHQNLTYGGMLGQYYLHGLGAYLSTLAYYWILILVYLVLYAAFWRGLVEAAALIAAWFSPARATTVRKWAEIMAMILYYGGIPAYIIWRSLA